MECPACNTDSMRPARLDFDLPARVCKHCEGILIHLLSYRHWLETSPKELDLQADAAIKAEEKQKAYTCKKCSRIMLKFKISTQTPNHVDLCMHCDDAFLERGEWNILKYLKLHKDLTKMFTEPWQRKIAKETEEHNYEQRFQTLLGHEDYSKLKETKEWLSKHQHTADIVRYLLKK